MKRLIYVSLFSILISFALFSSLYEAQGYEIQDSNTQGITDGTNKLINQVLKGFVPEGAKDIINNSQGALDTTKVSELASKSKNLINFDSFSTNDLITPIKAIVTLTINLLFVVIQVVVQILQALIGVINTHKPS